MWAWRPSGRCQVRRLAMSALTGATRRDLQVTVTQKPVSPGRARHKPLTPLRRECRCFGFICGDYLCAFYHCTQGCGCSQNTRHSLHPLFSGGTVRCTTRTHHGAGMRTRGRCVEWAKRSVPTVHESRCRWMVGTAQERLCPPYKLTSPPADHGHTAPAPGSCPALRANPQAALRPRRRPRRSPARHSRPPDRSADIERGC